MFVHFYLAFGTPQGLSLPFDPCTTIGGRHPNGPIELSHAFHGMHREVGSASIASSPIQAASAEIVVATLENN